MLSRHKLCIDKVLYCFKIQNMTMTLHSNLLIIEFSSKNAEALKYQKLLAIRKVNDVYFFFLPVHVFVRFS